MFGISQYKLLFMTELLVAEFLFFYRLEKRKNYLWRLLGGLVVCYAAAFFYPTGGGLTERFFLLYTFLHHAASCVRTVFVRVLSVFFAGKQYFVRRSRVGFFKDRGNGSLGDTRLYRYLRSDLRHSL